ncbi:MAG: tetratricopeptide repeat protein, partial [Flavobacteriales bacterium]
MAHRLFFILFLFCESLLFSQTADLDSLKTVLRNNTLADTTRVNTLFALIDQLKIDHLKPEESYLKDALAISISLEDKEKEAIARRQYAQYYRVKGIFDKSLEQLILAVKIFDSIHAPKSEKLIANSELSILYRNTGDLKKSLAIALKNYNLIKNDPDTPKKGRYYFDIGNCYSTLKNYKKAEEIYKAGIVICKNANFLPGEMLLTSALADIYKKNKQYNRAEKLFNKALLHYQKQKNDINIAASYYSLGTIHSLKGEHKKSIKPYLQALKIYNERENLYFIKVINQHLFIAYSILGQQEKAEKAQEIYDKIKDSIDSKERKKYTQELKT